MNQSPSLVEVAVDAPINGPLSYAVPENLVPLEQLAGMSVTVPLGKRKVKGVVLGASNQSSGDFKVKSILETDDSYAPISQQRLEWLSWIAKYYRHPIGQTVRLSFPPLKKADKIRKSNRAPVVPNVEVSQPPILTEEQRLAVESISKNDGFAVHLLHGVTGSGKTEVYLHLISETIRAGKKALVLVPEISLTPQLIDRFSARFPEKIAVIHSHLTEREKTNQWWDMVDGKKSILIGARSALFCPIDDWGIIVMDEEHEPSFKQDEKLKYHARDTAIVLAQKLNSKVILGSATPCLETWENALKGKYSYHKMGSRVSDRKMPNIHVVDMREERNLRKENGTKDDLPFWLSKKLFVAINETLDKKEQVALFLNRRGIAQTVICQSCGYVYECPNCAISLTLHGKSHLVCHYCEYTDRLSENCPQCPDGDVHPLGLGTELIEEDIKKMFPQARIGRADRDQIQNRDDLESLIKNMECREIDFLIGTQMIAKGLDFEGLTLVGLIMADVGFNLPDFRASERSFHILTQVSGRAGRHSNEPGNVYIQTYNPSHPSITFTRSNDYEGFANLELSQRRDLSYPPFGRVAALRFSDIKNERVFMVAEQWVDRAYDLKKQQPAYEPIMVLGPAQAPMAKLRGKFRYQVLVKSPSPKLLTTFLDQLFFDESWIPSGTKVQIDVDPLNML